MVITRRKRKVGDGGMSWYLGVRGGTFTLKSEQEANLLQFTAGTNLSMKKTYMIHWDLIDPQFSLFSSYCSFLCCHFRRFSKIFSYNPSQSFWDPKHQALMRSYAWQEEMNILMPVSGSGGTCFPRNFRSYQCFQEPSFALVPETLLHRRVLRARGA